MTLRGIGHRVNKERSKGSEASSTEKVNTIQSELLRSLVLIVDDDRSVRAQLRLWLELDGYRVVEAADGAGCLSAYSEHHPDLVLMDITLPDQDGFQCCEKLQSLSGAEYTPVLIISGRTDDTAIERAFELGVLDYIIKPIHWGLLRHQLRRLLLESQSSRRLESENQQLNRIATLDSLTRIPNRRRFDEHLDAMWRQMNREEGWLAVALGDVDFFKPYNDTYGHLAGDRCLQAIAATLSKCCRRPLDLVARYGGEEFGIILPKTDLEGAMKVATVMNQAVRESNLPHESSEVAPNVTISFGVAALYPRTNNIPDVLLEAADRALYSAKSLGRNCVFGIDLETRTLPQ
ncbi:MAG: diguanylate cyclase [Thermosynechococcaceae cyanobacterium MS004]|nr:diguanylate cyclase [Thermosynechococcaceae cyanobacterium MS004]